jgi:Ca2+-binding RTX toxin-like protein
MSASRITLSLEGAMDTAKSTVASNASPPVGYVTAVWLGMSPENIERGIAQGIIAPPTGSKEAAPLTAVASGAACLSTIVHADGTSDATGGVESATSSSDDGPAGLPDPAGKPDVKPLLVDRELVLGLIQKLDPSFDEASFDALWARAGTTDAERSSAWLDTLSRALGTSVPTSSDATTGDRIDAQMDALQSFLAVPGREARVVDLAGKSGDELLELAKGDAAYRYALTNLDSIAVVGNAVIDTARDAAGAMDRFDPDSGEQKLSDAYLADRAKLLAWKLSVEAGASSVVDGDQSWTFIDRRNTAADGSPYELDLESAADAATANTVVFGADTVSGELLKGGSGTDRMYAGSGDDVLRGNGGGDHLEGGAGDDLMLGGAGNDDMAGDQGADELDGGGGVDRLRGGSGDDTLTGGRGDDRLEGGVGHDAYAVDAGDGHDTIVDSDGDGEIRIDGAVLAGSSESQNGQWRSLDGRVRYSFSGDAAEGGTLTISYYASGDVAATAAPDSVTKVTGWHNGDLGIVLGDGTGAALAVDGATQSTITPPQNATIPLVPHQEGTSGNDGEGSTWIEPSSTSGDVAASTDASDSSTAPDVASAGDGLASLFGTLGVAADVSATLVTPDAMNAALVGWSGVAETPDVSVAHEGAPSAMGLSEADFSSALSAFDDGAHEVADHASLTVAAPPDVMSLISSADHLSAPAARVLTPAGQGKSG